MQDINHVMNEIKGMAQDVGFELEQQQNKIDAADKVVDDNLDTMDQAIEEIRDGARKADTDNKKMYGCCLLLVCVVIAMLYLLFSTTSSRVVQKVSPSPNQQLLDLAFKNSFQHFRIWPKENIIKAAEKYRINYFHIS